MYDGTEVIACGKDGEPEPTQKLQDLVNKYVVISTIKICIGEMVMIVVAIAELRGKNVVFPGMVNIFVLDLQGSMHSIFGRRRWGFL